MPAATHTMPPLEPAPNPLGSAADARAFLTSYWQSAPAVLRAGLSPDEAHRVITPARLRTLACHEDGEARLITRARNSGKSWRLDHGPFEAGDLPDNRAPRWSLLVQRVDCHIDSARALLERFRFVPDARLDDLMISMAGDGGGVGPHVDNYDVFLVQLRGCRQWELSARTDNSPPLQANQPLALLANFVPEITVELHPGDILYLPPGWAHNGIARAREHGSIRDICMTASVGFRSPTTGNLQSEWLHELAEQCLQADAADDVIQAVDLDRRDAAATARQIERWRRHPARIDNHLADQLLAGLEQPQPSKHQKHLFIGRYLSEPAAGVWFRQRGSAATRSAVKRARSNGVALDKASRMLWMDGSLFLNGESFDCDQPALGLLRSLADERALTAGDTKRLLETPDVCQVLEQWLGAGWIKPR